MARRQEAHQLRLSVYARYQFIRNALLVLLALSPLLYSLYIFFYLSAYLLTIATSSSHALETMSLALFTLPAHRNSGANGNVVVVVIVSVTVFVVAVTVVTVAVFVVVVAVTVDVVPSILKKREIIMKIIKRSGHRV